MPERFIIVEAAGCFGWCTDWQIFDTQEIKPLCTFSSGDFESEERGRDLMDYLCSRLNTDFPTIRTA